MTATTLLRDGEPLTHCHFDETNYTHPDVWTQRSARTILDQRADAWLHGHGDPTAPEAAAVRAQVRAAFADDDPNWITTCWPRFHEVLSAALHA